MATKNTASPSLKSSDYLHYYWEHSNDTGFLYSKLFDEKQKILMRQRALSRRRTNKWIKNQQAELDNINDGSHISLGKLYDDIKKNPQIFSGEMKAADLAGDNVIDEPQTFEQALGITSQENVSSWVEELQTGLGSLVRAAEKITKGDKNLASTYMKYIKELYLSNCIRAGYIEPGTEFDNDVAKDVINKFRKHELRKQMWLFKIPDNLQGDYYNCIKNLEAYQREVFVLIAAISSISGIETNEGGGWESIETEWQKQCDGLGKAAGGKVHELASAKALVSATEKLFQEDDNVTKEIMNNISGHVIGNNNIQIKTEMKRNHTYELLKQERVSNSSGIVHKVSKPDIELTYSDNGVKVSLLRATVKKGLSTYTDDETLLTGRSGKYLMLHHGAPFLNFMYREMNMTSKDLHSLVQMLVATSSTGTDLDGAWQIFKDNVAYSAFLSALVGWSREQEGAQFMIVGDNIVSVDDIVTAAMNVSSEDIVPYAEYSPDYNRQPFVSGGKWVLPSRRSTFSAERRSEYAWQHASENLRQMHLNIKMSISQNFIMNKLKA